MIAIVRVNKHTATLFTFFLSALVHELVMWCIFKKLRGYLLFMQMLQLPVSTRVPALFFSIPPPPAAQAAASSLKDSRADFVCQKLVQLSRTKWMKGRKTLGNINFWLGIFTGPSVLCSLYLIL